MAHRFEISNAILEEVRSITDKGYLEDLALMILRFELDNWRKERTRYTSDYEEMIERAARRKYG